MEEYKHELVVPGKDIPFRIFEFEGRLGNYAVPKHWHNEVEIFCVVEGYIDFYINSVCYSLNSGESIIVNADEIHSVKAEHPNKVVVLQIPKSTLKMYHGHESIHFAQVYDKKDEKLFKTVVDIFMTAEKKESTYIYSLLGKYYMLLEYLFKTYREDAGTNVLKQMDDISRLSCITDFIKENCDREISLDEVAKRFGYTSSYLSKLFKQSTSINYKTFVDTVRLNNAYNELLNTDASVNDIAYNNGFPNVKSFINVFKKRYGLTPHAYRIKIKNDNFHGKNII